MAKGTAIWTAGLAMALSAVGLTPPASAEPLAPLCLSLLMLNQSEVPRPVLVQAQAEATRIYGALGVHLIWIGAPAPGAVSDFTVKIVRAPLSTKERDADALGVAPGTVTARGKIAYAFSVRIEDFSRTHGVSIAVLLGHVIAHELGHLLLPYDSHSKTGIMSGRWDDQQAIRAAHGALLFNTPESSLIRETVSGLRLVACPPSSHFFR
jgi:hypothetical protein